MARDLMGIAIFALAVIALTLLTSSGVWLNALIGPLHIRANDTRITAAVKTKRRIAPAGVWLLDNFYLIEEQIRTARRHLPKDYSRGLPRLGLPLRARVTHVRGADARLEARGGAQPARPERPLRARGGPLR